MKEALHVGGVIIQRVEAHLFRSHACQGRHTGHGHEAHLRQVEGGSLSLPGIINNMARSGFWECGG